MLSTLTLPSPAKLNLFLHITGQRADGYHNLQTIFQFVDYADTLTFTLREDGMITLSPALADIASQDNLIVKAARLLQQQSQSQLGVDIHLNKIIPMGAGLGGGSSNAATTLLALNILWNLHWPNEKLAQLGLSLGADVPIFVYGRAAWAEGVGEALTPLELPEPVYVVLKPDCKIGTREIFTHPALTRNTPPITVSPHAAQHGQNDCEAIVSELYPPVQNALLWLRQYGNAKLTGTGCCIFVDCSTVEQANKILAKSTVDGFVTRGYNLSPAHKALQKYLS
ncbi:MAG TPA: 4-(cytidine 5'-diphospho)-2-C-methyl-D-erythritol kinase [Agitococcus sp.]|nr:4-(cytidine 5'-diphospho)-2-C-methyl-D-erythritol kinase [Agitococcus sp.]HNA22308.1 4-(cytidine 5'-diphospho)-2-C-methyl-D-erythritol kinase [Agitococcus sp.]HNB19219.1 4-(cytidine 5'-diphospho)-2-C-methyl-D-erythritol kinase [Agitococcus sp.]HNC01746.1 4-(cytidine 5'-diphospho)-2-C-methyl-D-erythritol kinase [Agitococcus sp.]HNE91852.1 4-(cytidine 5'-diphospho)-2-C-methyl-D-erythritol kinase [Agitococcus sp.]